MRNDKDDSLVSQFKEQVKVENVDRLLKRIPICHLIVYENETAFEQKKARMKDLEFTAIS